MSTRQIIDLIAAEVGAPVRVSAAPRLLLRAMGVFDNTVRELDEMLYEFTQPFVTDTTKAETRLGITPTPLPEAVSATVAWFRQHAASS
jgi:hypothetical protein